MTPIFFNSSSHTYNSPYPSDDHLGNHQFLNPNSQPTLSSSNSLAAHLFLNSDVHDQIGTTFDRDIQPPQYQQQGDNFRSSQAYNDHPIESNDNKSLEFSRWGRSGINDMIKNDQNQMKWMSSKMRVMLKMKKSEPVNIKFYSSATRETSKHEDHKSPITYPIMEETDNSSNSICSNNNFPIRVCSDCNTTKTPLWRSGPQGPKSLCNACGIRQRKARRALAIAAAENGNSNILGDQSMIMAPLKVTKTHLKEFKKPNNNGQVTKYKKRQYSNKHMKTTKVVTTTITPPSSPSSSPSSSSSPARKNCVEDFLVSLSKNLTFNYHVFPQDEKEAAILLMAISCGYAHET